MVLAAALGAATNTFGQEPASPTGCSLSPGEYERAGYTIRKLDVRNVFDFARHVTTADGQPAVVFPRAGAPFRVSEATDAAEALRTLLANRPAENESPFAVTIVVDFIDHCTDIAQASANAPGQLDLVYRAVTNRIPLVSGMTFESRGEQRDDAPHALGAVNNASLIRATPKFNYTRSDRFEAGGQLLVRAPARIFDTLDLDGIGSSASHLLRGGLRGTHDSSGPLAHSEWRLSWSDSKRPTDSASLNGHRLLGQAAAATRPLGSLGAIVRFGGSVEDGTQQTSLAQNLSGSGFINNTDYGALRTYAGVTLGTTHHSFAGSYGLLLGNVPAGPVVDYRKYIVDSAYTLLQPIGDHRALAVESRVTAGWLVHGGRAPAAERFFGGNVPLDFVEGDTWHIQANPTIRSLPNGFLNRVSEAPGTGGENFFSVNITVSAPAWRLPLLPSEVSRLTGFKDAMTQVRTTAREQTSAYYRSKDPAQKQIAQEVPAVSAALTTLLTEIQAVRTTAPDALRQPVADCADALDLSQDRMQHLRDTGFGPIATIIIPDVLNACDASLISSLGNQTVAVQSAQLASLRDSIAAIARTFDEAAISRRVDGDLGFAFRAFDTFVQDVNILSIAPLAVFDAARLGPQIDALAGGVRYGVGGGVRLSVMNLLNLSAGYAMNPSPQPWEPRGAFFFSLDIVDLFR